MPNARGFGFCQPQAAPAIFVPNGHARDALPGDRVRVCWRLNRDGRVSGRVVKVYAEPTRIVGRICRLDADVCLRATDGQWPIIALAGADDVQAGELAECEVTGRQRDALGRVQGRVIRRLGTSWNKDTVNAAVVAALRLHEEFSPAALAQAMDLKKQATGMGPGRKDLRHLALVTIDGEDSRDFDDAIHAEYGQGGSIRLTVAIADVSHYVTPGSALDIEAQRRGTSVYLPGQALPMLPPVLSEDLCSLVPGADRPCLACVADIDPHGEVVASEFFLGMMRSRQRLTYAQAQDLLDTGVGDAADGVNACLTTLRELTVRLLAASARRGTVDFERDEQVVVFDERGMATQMRDTQRLFVHRMVEECMVTANVLAARMVEDAALWRFHAAPAQDKLRGLQALLASAGLRALPRNGLRPRHLQQAQRHAAAAGEQVGMRARHLSWRAQSRAVYSTNERGHFGLALDHYTHFTSPIRRYPDLLVHRAIVARLSGVRPPAVATACVAMCNMTQARADKAERDAVARHKTVMLSAMLARAPVVMDGTVRACRRDAVLVEAGQMKVCGYIPVQRLPGTAWHLDADEGFLVDQAGNVLMPGMPVRVAVVEANADSGETMFDWVEAAPAQA